MASRIGYQGISGSYSEKAAILLATQAKLPDQQLVPLLSSSQVIKDLTNGRIEYGVVATRNTTAGSVEETESALRGGRFAVVETVRLSINHAVFLQCKEANPNAVKEVRSHEQALRQSATNLNNLFPTASKIPIEDTAIGAARLADGKYGPHVAVVCSRDTGEAYGLHLYRQNVQDLPDNKTEFVLLKTASKQTPPERPDNFGTRLAIKTVTKDSLSIITKTLVVITILAGVTAKEIFGLSSLRAAFTIGAVASGIFLLLTSNKIQSWLQFRSIKGYWRYSLYPDDDKPLVAQDHTIPRVVRIDEGDSGLRLQGWMCKTPVAPWFESTQVLLSPFGTKNGRLVYWYTNTIEAKKGSFLDGVVSLGWSKSHTNDRLDCMSGWYVGRLTGDIGVIRYERITRAEFASTVAGTEGIARRRGGQASHVTHSPDLEV